MRHLVTDPAVDPRIGSLHPLLALGRLLEASLDPVAAFLSMIPPDPNVVLEVCTPRTACRVAVELKVLFAQIKSTWSIFPMKGSGWPMVRSGWYCFKPPCGCPFTDICEEIRCEVL